MFIGAFAAGREALLARELKAAVHEVLEHVKAGGLTPASGAGWLGREFGSGTR